MVAQLGWCSEKWSDCHNLLKDSMWRGGEDSREAVMLLSWATGRMALPFFQAEKGCRRMDWIGR